MRGTKVDAISASYAEGSREGRRDERQTWRREVEALRWECRYRVNEPGHARMYRAQNTWFYDRLTALLARLAPGEASVRERQCDTCGKLYTDDGVARFHEADHPGHKVLPVPAGIGMDKDAALGKELRVYPAAAPAAPKAEDWRGPWKCNRCSREFHKPLALHYPGNITTFGVSTEEFCTGNLVPYERRKGGGG